MPLAGNIERFMDSFLVLLVSVLTYFLHISACFFFWLNITQLYIGLMA